MAEPVVKHRRIGSRSGGRRGATATAGADVNANAAVVRSDAVDGVMNEKELVKQILAHASMGSLQVFSMANRFWSTEVFRLAGALEVDLNNWPFGLREYQRRDQVFISDLGGDFLKSDGVPAALRDSQVSDADVQLALRKLRPTQLRKLVLSSSRLTTSSLCWALDTFAPGLEALSLSADLGKLQVADLQASLDKCTKLSFLHLEHVEVTPPKGAKLQQLILGPGVMRSRHQLWSSMHFQHLKVLKFTRNADIRPMPVEFVYYWFLNVFRHSHQLEEIIISNVTQVTNEMLAVLMHNVPGLRRFYGCFTRPFFGLSGRVAFPFSDGLRDLDPGDLYPEAVEIFKAHFAEAEINVYAERRHFVPD